MLARETGSVGGIEDYAAYTCVRIGINVFFYRSLDGALCKYDILSNRVHLLSPWVEGIRYSNEPVEWIGNEGKALISISGDGDMVITHGEVEQKNLFNSESKGWGNYVYVEQKDKTIIAISRKKPEFITMNVESDYSKAAKRVPINFDIKGMLWDACKIENIVWIVEKNVDFLLWVNLETGETGKENIGLIINNISCIEQREHFIIIMTEEGSLYEYDTKDRIIKSIFISEKNYGMGKLLLGENYFLELPASGKDIIRISKDTSCAWVADNYEDDFCYKNCTTEYKFTAFFEYSGKVYCLPRKANYILSFDGEKGNVNWIKPQLPDEKEKREYLRKIKISSGQNFKMSLEEYLTMISI